MKKILFIIFLSIVPVFSSCEKDQDIIMKYSVLDIFFDKNGGTQTIVQAKERKEQLVNYGIRWIYDERADVRYMSESATFAKADGITVTLDAKNRYIVTVSPAQEFRSWQIITSAADIRVNQKWDYSTN